MIIAAPAAEPRDGECGGAPPLCRGHGGVPRILLHHPLPGEEGGRGDGRKGCLGIDALPAAQRALRQAWQRGDKITATLGDGSEITAVGRPRNWTCEVHSDRGVEHRQSTELVLTQPYVEPPKQPVETWPLVSNG